MVVGCMTSVFSSALRARLAAADTKLPEVFHMPNGFRITDSSRLAV